MYSVKVPRQTEAQAGWEWHPSQMPAKRSVLSRSGLSKSSAAGITLLAAGWFAWPADAARQWDSARYLSPAHEMFGWNGARNTHTSPQAVLIEFAQREGTDGAVVPPVKRQAPQMPATQPEAPAPTPVQESPPAPAADAPKPGVRQPSAQQAQPSAETAPAGSWFDALTARMTEWLAKANREYQGTIVKELSKPGSEDADAARLAAEKAAQEQAAREQAERARAEQEQARQAAAAEEDTQTGRGGRAPQSGRGCKSR